MLKPNIECIRDGQPQALLVWHKPDGQGGHIPIAVEFEDTLDDETRRKIEDVCARPLNLREGGVVKTGQPGSSTHFLALPKVLERFGFRVRTF